MKNEESDWDLIILPSNKLLDLKLKNVWNYRDLLWLFVKRDFVSFYKQTILGPIWFFIQPIFSTAIYVFVFGNLAGISTDGVPQPLFYLIGINAWTYFSECLTKTASVFKDNIGIFGKVYFPRLIMPLSIVVSNLVKFAVQMLLFLFVLLFYRLNYGYNNMNYYTLLFPFFVAILAFQALGWGMIVSSLTTKYRDLVLLLTFGIQLLMYSTTVIYPLSSLNGVVKTLISYNPITVIIEGLRFSLLGQGTFSMSMFAYAIINTLVITFIGVITFNKVEKDFVDTI
ncbi:ABC transporter permease [Aquirufa lenticrescens]